MKRENLLAEIEKEGWNIEYHKAELEKAHKRLKELEEELELLEGEDES